MNLAQVSGQPRVRYTGMGGKVEVTFSLTLKKGTREFQAEPEKLGSGLGMARGRSGSGSQGGTA